MYWPVTGAHGALLMMTKQHTTGFLPFPRPADAKPASIATVLNLVMPGMRKGSSSSCSFRLVTEVFCSDSRRTPFEFSHPLLAPGLSFASNGQCFTKRIITKPALEPQTFAHVQAATGGTERVNASEGGRTVASTAHDHVRNSGDRERRKVTLNHIS